MGQKDAPPRHEVLVGFGIGALVGALTVIGLIAYWQLFVQDPTGGTILFVFAVPGCLIATAVGGGVGAFMGWLVRRDRS